MHWIQREILRKLSKADTARYSDLRPKEVEGNLFLYHVRQLQNAGLVVHEDKVYALSPEGKAYVARLSQSTGKSVEQPHILVAVLYRQGDRCLLYRWNRQPYMSQVSLPFGSMRTGWKLQDMAAEQLHYKSGLTVDSWRFRGSANLQVRNVDSQARHNLIYVFEATGPGGNPSADGLTGQPFWGGPADYESDFVPGFYELARHLDGSEEPFHIELEIGQ